MRYVLRVMRSCSNGMNRWQEFEYIAKSENDTIATALTDINEREPVKDISGNIAEPIGWECSCLQKKCGACAMVIDGRPRLACDARLSEFKPPMVKVEPLRKFPVVRDLIVDRRIMFENLKTLKLWLKTDSYLSDSDTELAYAASECIQCGCCLEVCPNFYVGGSFFGMATVPITTRLLSEMPKSAHKELTRLYARHTFEGCGKSLSCKDICPKHIDTEDLLVNANALALWKRKKGNSK